MLCEPSRPAKGVPGKGSHHIRLKIMPTQFRCTNCEKITTPLPDPPKCEFRGHSNGVIEPTSTSGHERLQTGGRK